MAYNDASIDAPNEEAPSQSADSELETEKRVRLQKIDAERLVDALKSLKYYTERKLAQLTGGGGGGGGGFRKGGRGNRGRAAKNGKIPGRLSSGSESDVGEATSDEDVGTGDDAEGTVDLFWSRWDDAGGEDDAGNAGKAPSNGNPATRHHSLSLGNTHGVNQVLTTVKAETLH